jgi:hypothetical protein
MAMIPSRKANLALLSGVALLMTACSGVKQPAAVGAGGGGTGSFTVGGSVTGLAGSGLVLTDNITDVLPITGTGTVPFTFTQKVSGAYSVAVSTQPSNPAQTCTVTGGTGTATAIVTGVSVACTTNPVTATIGGQLTGLQANSQVVLQNNGGDSLTLTANGSFTFKTPVTGPTDAYAVTVLTQPANPLQICTVTNGSGTATGNVTNVAVGCVLAYTVGGTVNGVVGTGLILENTGAEQLAITSNGAFTFKNPVPTGFAYQISIFQQPTTPAQKCSIQPGTDSGTATATVTSVVVNCQAVTFSVGGNIVGLRGISPTNGALTDNSFAIQNNLGDTKIISENGSFTFATPEAYNANYNISVFTSPSTQPQGCTVWNFHGVVTGNVNSIIVDCAHNDWTWIDGTKTAGYAGKPIYGSFPQSAPTTDPNPYTNTPGARYGGAAWTDAHGSMFLFGGFGFELAGSKAPDTLEASMNDLWVCVKTYDFCQWQLVGGYEAVFGAGIQNWAQTEGQPAVYTNLGSTFPNPNPIPTPIPGARWGAMTWKDNTGKFWLFGGNGNTDTANGLLNDLWTYDPSAFNGSNYTTAVGQWVFIPGGSNQVNQPGVYTGSPYPGARVSAVIWTDASSGNVWMFGGYGYDGSGKVGFLNDLWKFNGTTWTYVTGSETANPTGVYGTAGTPSNSNFPGGRQEAVGWLDGFGHLWLFGGEGFDSTGTVTGILNDLWMYDITGNQWTYVMGSNLANQTGSYELQPMIGPVSTNGAAGLCGLVPGDTNLGCSPVDTTGAMPGSRWGASAWTDSGGNFWLFGGWGLDSTGTNGNGGLNDTWVYTPNATAGQPGTWVWAKGSPTGNANGNYGPETRPYFTYYIWTPGGRNNATSWIDNQGQLWLFGGEGFDATSSTGNGYLNDMWRYLPYPN